MTRKLKETAPVTSQESKSAAQAYKPTAEERVALTALLARVTETMPSPRLKVTGTDNSTKTALDHPDSTIGQLLLMEALGTTNSDFARELVEQLLNVGTRDGKANENGLNFQLAVVKGVKPRDEIEAMLAGQMAAVHASTMTFAGRLASTNLIDQAESAERALNRLARTFTAQIEALKRYRGGGEQRVVVQHQHVNVAANQAQVNVGSAPRGGEVSPKTAEQSHEKPAALTHAPEQPMPCTIEANREAVPSGSSERLDRLPQPRGRRRSAEGH